MNTYQNTNTDFTEAILYNIPSSFSSRPLLLFSPYRHLEIITSLCLYFDSNRAPWTKRHRVSFHTQRNRAIINSAIAIYAQNNRKTRPIFTHRGTIAKTNSNPHTPVDMERSGNRTPSDTMNIMGRVLPYLWSLISSPQWQIGTLYADRLVSLGCRNSHRNPEDRVNILICSLIL